MKLLLLAVTVLFAACQKSEVPANNKENTGKGQSHESYVAIGSVYLTEDPKTWGDTHPIVSLLKSKGIKCFLGESSLATCDLWCAPNDVKIAQVTLQKLSKSQREWVHKLHDDTSTKFGDWRRQ